MIHNIFKIAMRYLWRNKTYSILNFLCLIFGITCSVIALLVILNAFSYDKFHKNYDRIYSVEAYVTYFNGSSFPKQYLSASLAEKLKAQAPEIEEYVRIAERNLGFSNGKLSFSENGIYADSSIYRVFTFPLVRGSHPECFSKQNAIIISEKMAEKFFQDKNCIGKTLTLKEDKSERIYEVTGVLKNVPTQSFLQFDFIIPFSNFMALNSWANETGATANETWVLLRNNAKRTSVETKIKNLIKNQESTLNQTLFLFPLKEKILYSYADGKRVWREMQNMVIVGCIGLAILLIACFNFINMAIVLNLKRHHEAGIRKVSGASKSSLIMQFLFETLLVTVISTIYAIMLVEIALSGYNSIFGADIHLSFSNPVIGVILIGIIAFTTLTSGLFPALYLASANPINVLKGKITTNQSYSKFRQGLIVFQFTIPVALIIMMMIFKTQDNYMRTYDLGFEKDQLILINNTENIQNHAESVKAEILSIPEVEGASFSNCIPSRSARVTSEVSWEGQDATEKLHFWCINTDFDYARTIGLKLIAGRFFSPQFSSDSTNYIINDVAAGAIKYDKALGRTITVEGRRGTIIGIISGFHAIDLAGPYVPTIIRLNDNDRDNLLVKFSGHYPTIVEKLRKIYTKYETEQPFQPRLFADTEISQLRVPSRLVGLASFIAILLACMGLFGLASFMTVSKTKEIGIRKANGATTISIMQLLLRNYARWITISILIGIPVAYLLGKLFLSKFFFHTALPWWAFMAGPLIVYAVALSTVSWQAYRAANQNPVEALRYE